MLAQVVIVFHAGKQRSTESSQNTHLDDLQDPRLVHDRHHTPLLLPLQHRTRFLIQHPYEPPMSRLEESLIRVLAWKIVVFRAAGSSAQRARYMWRRGRHEEEAGSVVEEPEEGVYVKRERMSLF